MTTLVCAAAIWLIGRPGDFTNVGTSVANGTTSVLNAAFAKLPAPAGSNCLPVNTGDPQSVANYSFTSGNGLVDQNANELWTVLVCKPWLDGELGTTQYAAPGTTQPQTVVNQYGRQLLWAQAVAGNEQPVTTTLYNAKQATYNGIAMQLQQTQHVGEILAMESIAERLQVASGGTVVECTTVDRLQHLQG